MALHALVVDDHPLVCEALQFAIQAASADLVAETADWVAAMERAARPDRPFRLVVLDLMLPGHSASPLLASEN